MASESRIDEVRPAIEDRLGGEAHLTTALPGMLEVRSLSRQANVMKLSHWPGPKLAPRQLHCQAPSGSVLVFTPCS